MAQAPQKCQVVRVWREGKDELLPLHRIRMWRGIWGKEGSSFPSRIQGQDRGGEAPPTNEERAGPVLEAVIPRCADIKVA